MEVTRSAVRNVARSSSFSPVSASLEPSGNRDSYSSGHRSWWSNTKRDPSRIRNQRASGQKMSGGLQAWMTSNRPRPARLQSQPQRGQERVGVLEHEAERAPAGRVGTVAVDRHPVDDLVGAGVLPARADHGDVVAGVAKGPALEPDPPVEGDGQVLDDDQDARRAPSPAHPAVAGHLLDLGAEPAGQVDDVRRSRLPQRGGHHRPGGGDEHDLGARRAPPRGSGRAAG